MSVQNNNYIIYGARLPYPDTSYTDGDSLYDYLEKWMDSAYKTTDVNLNDDTTVIFDGMSGEYMVIGKVFYKSEVYEEPFYDREILDRSNMFDELGIKTLTEEEITKISIAIDTIYPTGKVKKLDWQIFTHYR